MSTMTTTDELHDVLLELLPPQGDWSEEEYLWLTDHTNRLIEFTDGYIEVLPMPTDEHQGISGLFFLAFTQFLQPIGGVVRYSPLRLRLRAGKHREPDLMVLRVKPDFSPLDFSQRYTGTFSDDGKTIAGAWEICHDGTTWEHDFDLSYIKA